MEKFAMKGMKLLKPEGSESIGAAIHQIPLFAMGYDTSLPIENIERALIKHFSSCGEIAKVRVPQDHQTGEISNVSLVYIREEGAFKKAKKLNGRCECDVKGCKIVVDKVMPPFTKECLKHQQCGYSVPAYYIQKAKEAKMAKDAKEGK